MAGLDPSALPLRGTQLIEASAGTGKTHTIATLYLRLLLERRMTVDQILVVTFTEAAAAELRDRIRDRVRGALSDHADDTAATDHLEQALRTFDEAAISTIHGFCHRVLIDSAFETGVPFDTELIVNPQPLIDLAVRDLWAKEVYDADPMFVSFLQRERVTPTRLVKLASIASSHPRAPVIPSKVEIGDHPDAAPFRAAFTEAREIWWAERDAIITTLVEHEGLYKNVYRREDLSAWFQSLDAFFRDEDPGATLGPPALDRLTTQTLRKYTRDEYIKRGEEPSHAFFEACAALAKARAPLSENHSLRYIALKRRLIDYVRRELPRRKHAAAVQSFDDLLHSLRKALARRGGANLAAAIRERYRAALIDEFQDTDPVQFAIFNAIYGKAEGPLFLIGDPKQAIYGFRGADIFAYLGASAAASDRHTLGHNWRSDPSLVAALEHLFDVRRPFLIEDIGFIRVQPRPGAVDGLRLDDEAMPALEIKFQRRDRAQCRGVKSPMITIEWAEQRIPELIAADISALLASGATIDGRPVGAGDVAVLVRKNAQAQQVQAALRAHRIPGVVFGDASVFDSREAQELARVLAAVAEPTHNGFMRAAITTELLGVTGEELDAMSDDDGALSLWVHNLRHWHEVWVGRGFIQMFRAMLHDSGASGRLLTLSDGERRMTNLLHLAELLHTAASTEHLGPAGLLRWFQEARRLDQSMAEAVKLRLERDDQAVQLITVHRAKGLEYPIVYCPYVWDPDELRADEEENLLFHDPQDRNRLKLDIRPKAKTKHQRGSDPNIARARFENDAESMRLLYVAVTRARHRCVVVWGAFDRAHRSPLGYLLHAPEASEEWGWDRDMISGKIKSSSDDQLLAWLAERKHETWTVTELDAPAATHFLPKLAVVPELHSRSPRPKIDRHYRTSSFTHMTASKSGSRVVEAIGGRDHDEFVTAASEAEAAGARRVLLADFPRGAKAGNFFHEILEDIDFDGEASQLQEVTASKLRAFGFPPTLQSQACAGVREVLDTTLLPQSALKLRSVPRAARCSELGFLFPVAHNSERERAVARHGLARVFKEHPGGLPEGYADRVAALPFAPLRGFLKGFIDLVFRDDGRYYLVDYKTNHLGDTASEYAEKRLSEVMAHEHYILQYHLYLVATLRHLRLRDPNFDYERNFGGVLYLFVRGMSPQTGPSFGIYRDRPSLDRMDALSALMTAPPEVAL